MCLLLCLQSFDELDQDAEGEAEPDLLNFSIGESEGGSDGYSTPASGRAYPLSQTSASWVDEMNAELADLFPNMPVEKRQERIMAVYVARWLQRMFLPDIYIHA